MLIKCVFNILKYSLTIYTQTNFSSNILRVFILFAILHNLHIISSLISPEKLQKVPSLV